MLHRRYLAKRKMVWLELTPPAAADKTPEATVQLFSVIHGMRAARHMKDRLLRRAPVMSFEIVSTRGSGIRYLIQVEAARSESIQKVITSYIPDSKVAAVEPPDTSVDSVIEFKQRSHYVLPLTLTSAIEQHDPLSYITGAMTKLEDGEQIIMQLVLSPIQLREAARLSQRILTHDDILKRVQRGGGLSVIHTIGGFTSRIMLGLAELIGEFLGGSPQRQTKAGPGNDAQRQAQVAKRERPARTLSSFEQELMASMHQKVTQPLFQVSLRVLVTSNQPKELIAAIRSALDAYSVPPYQGLMAKKWLPLVNYRRKQLAVNRLPALLRRHALILSAAEVASFYHFPSRKISQTDNLITSLSRTLPAPVSLKSGRKLAVLMGENHHHGVVTQIGLTEAERERHVYIIGGTGNGKTTMLQYALIQDIKNGNGVAVVDPHGDMAETLLRHVPEDRIKDVIYMNPDDLAYPISMNLLELTPGLTGDDLLREKDLITESIISIFRKIFSDADNGGHRIEYVLRNTIHTALTQEDATLFTIFNLLNDPKYRRSVIKELQDKDLKNFWNNELGKAGDMQRVKMIAGITAKIGRFLFSASARRILEQPKSTIDFDDIIDSGKILICNFSKGLIGEDASELFGITVLAKLQLAALRRARLKQTDRRPFYLYVDEFQNFATTSFVQMLSEARKYKLFLLMAEQSTSQQKDQHMVNVILANVGTVICFRTGNPADERAVLPMFAPFINEGEITHLPSYSFYARIAAVHSQEPMSGKTVLLVDEGNEDVAQLVITSSRKLYATKSSTKKRNEASEVRVSSAASTNAKRKVLKKKMNAANSVRRSALR